MNTESFKLFINAVAGEFEESKYLLTKNHSKNLLLLYYLLKEDLIIWRYAEWFSNSIVIAKRPSWICELSNILIKTSAISSFNSVYSDANSTP